MLSLLFNQEPFDWGQEYPQVNFQLKLLSVDEDSVVFIVTPPIFIGFANAIYKIDSTLAATYSSLQVEDRISLYKVDTTDQASFAKLEAANQISIYKIETAYGAVVLTTGGFGVGPFGNFPFGT